MKHLFFILIVFLSSCTIHSTPNTLQSQTPVQAHEQEDQDGKIVIENVGVMIQALGAFAGAPNNPVIAGAAALQALGAFIKILIQIFDDFAPTRNLHSQQDIEKLFLYLPKEKQMRIMQLVVVCAEKYKIAKEV